MGNCRVCGRDFCKGRYCHVCVSLGITSKAALAKFIEDYPDCARKMGKGQMWIRVSWAAAFLEKSEPKAPSEKSKKSPKKAPESGDEEFGIVEATAVDEE